MGFISQELSEFPHIININVFRGECPCSCIHCPVGRTKASERDTRFSRGEISLDLFKRVVDEIADGHLESTLRIHSVGEPLLWRSLSDAIKYAHNKGVNTWIFTCAVTNDKKLLEELCENVDIIEVSVNSFNAEDYKNTKGIDAFENVSDNIKFMAEYILRNSLNSRLLCSRVQTENKESDKAFVDYWKKYEGISDVFVRSFHNYNGLLGTDGIQNNVTRKACLVNWARFNIDINGNAVVCFNELFKEHIDKNIILGNIKRTRIADIWKCDELNNIRKYQLGKIDTLNINIPCNECTTCQKYPPHDNTSEKQIRMLQRNVENKN